jgi:hypothetical protein
MKRFIIFLLTFVALWSLWFFGFPNTIIWLEGFSFFCTLPDYTGLNLDIPGSVFQYMAAFLLQFYKWPAVGAAIHSLLPVLFVFFVWIAVSRLFSKSEGLLWIAYLPLPWFIYSQMNDLTLIEPVIMLSATAAVALIAVLIRMAAKKGLPSWKFMHGKWLEMVLIVLCVGASIFMVPGKQMNRKFEQIASLEYLATRQDWDKIIKTVSRKEALEDEYMRKYVLLALSETGRLADEAFRYGLAGSGDFIFQKQKTALCYNFNMLFYRSLGMDNPAVYYAYEEAFLSASGLSFNALRTMVDAYIHLKDYKLAKKYMDILSHSTCHGKWVRERLDALEGIKDSEPEYENPEIKIPWGKFKLDMAFMAESHPEDHKIADYMLCGLLADRYGFEFYDEFRKMAPSRFAPGQHVPRIYQEALLMLISQKPEEIRQYGIDDEVIDDFVEFSDLVSQGKAALARRKFAGTYWAYIYH